jgi:adenylosuccinate lyase
VPGTVTPSLSLLDLLKADPKVTALLPPDKLEESFDLAYHLKHVDTIFERVFGQTIEA